MFKQSLIILVVSFLFAISCKENVTENEPQTLSDVKIIHPNGGEKFIGLEQDTIWWNNPESIESMGLYYTLDNGKNWVTILYDEQIKTGYYVWDIPDIETREGKIKLIIAAGTESTTVISDSSFSIEKRGIKIIQPSGSEIYNYPGILNIKWKSNVFVEKYELYYSKYSETVILYGYPDNKVVYSSGWILLNENVDGALREYTWDIPYLYSNKVQIKVIGFAGNDAYEAVNDDAFTVHFDEILTDERQYQEKLSIGNKWVYKITEEYFETENYYLVKDVIGQFVQDGKKFYEIREKLIRDSVSYSLVEAQDREHYSPAHILQDGDIFAQENYSGENGNWGIFQYVSNSCKFYEEEVFSERLLIKEYNFYSSGSGIFSLKTKRAKDFGTYYKKSNSEGFFRTTILTGALIDGIAYGDTTTVK